MLILPVFTAQKGSWIFIDEPENNLHPAFQNIFIRAISENLAILKKELRFFINTHSNHILSEALLSTCETEIMVFSRRDKDSSNISVFGGNEYATLEMLGVLNTSVLISNCTIWVEGITDRLYLRAFLKAYCRSKKQSEHLEGFHYSFVEYGGVNLIHYNFDHVTSKNITETDHQINAFFINSKVFLLADSDFSQDKKHARYDKIASERPNFEYHKTGLPEIENILPATILKSWLISQFQCDQKEVEQAFSIDHNEKKLGEFLTNKISYGKAKRKFTNPGEGGTLRSGYKSSLAEYVQKGVVDGSITWKELKESEKLEEITLAMDKFISEKNKK